MSESKGGSSGMVRSILFDLADRTVDDYHIYTTIKASMLDGAQAKKKEKKSVVPRKHRGAIKTQRSFSRISEDASILAMQQDMQPVQLCGRVAPHLPAQHGCSGVPTKQNAVVEKQIVAKDDPPRNELLMGPFRAFQPVVHLQQSYWKYGGACGFFALHNAICSLAALTCEDPKESKQWLRMLSSATGFYLSLRDMLQVVEFRVGKAKREQKRQWVCDNPKGDVSTQEFKGDSIWNDQVVNGMEIHMTHTAYLIRNFPLLKALGGDASIFCAPTMSRNGLQHCMVSFRDARCMEAALAACSTCAKSTSSAKKLKDGSFDGEPVKGGACAFIVGSVDHWVTVVVNVPASAHYSPPSKEPEGKLQLRRDPSLPQSSVVQEMRRRKKKSRTERLREAWMTDVPAHAEVIFMDCRNVPTVGHSAFQIGHFCYVDCFDSIPWWVKRLGDKDNFKKYDKKHLRELVMYGNGTYRWSPDFVEPFDVKWSKWAKTCYERGLLISLVGDSAARYRSVYTSYLAEIVRGICNLFKPPDDSQHIARDPTSNSREAVSLLAFSMDVDSRVDARLALGKTTPVSVSAQDVEGFLTKSYFHPAQIEREIIPLMMDLGYESLGQESAALLSDWTRSAVKACEVVQAMLRNRDEGLATAVLAKRDKHMTTLTRLGRSFKFFGSFAKRAVPTIEGKRQ